jgi:hypothetical protein
MAPTKWHYVLISLFKFFLFFCVSYCNRFPCFFNIFSSFLITMSYGTRNPWSKAQFEPLYRQFIWNWTERSNNTTNHKHFLNCVRRLPKIKQRDDLHWHVQIFTGTSSSQANLTWPCFQWQALPCQWWRADSAHFLRVRKNSLARATRWPSEESKHIQFLLYFSGWARRGENRQWNQQRPTLRR